ncbi:catalase family peroxidase [Glaciecola sp. MH2013]|uniref:catalase family peroxidase n=1 Tax=Glaciecola sp. MH2013 TaxID=2785524 RepID=UPI00189F474F|nr:catalase family peroxidase [Glaciecola sp. MH2013]MBF7073142.1 catalase family peroxidase [Glaciecola sp. MH2013]
MLKSNISLSVAFALLTSLSATHLLHAQESKSPVEFVELFEKLSGKHPGVRKAHANGVCAKARFEPNKALAAHSSSPIFTQDTIDATLRFSLGGGNPNADERVAGTRGMAIQLNLPNGAKHNIVGNNTPVFAAKNPDIFFGLLERLLPGEDGKVDYAKLGAYIAQNPSTQRLAAWNQQVQTPYSYANTEFFGLHTFFMTNKEGKETKFRWHTTPDLGVQSMDKESAGKLETPFLAKRLQQQMDEGKTISYTITYALGTDEDTNVDPSQPWPAERPTKTMGKLTLTSVGGEACTGINFDPNVVGEGYKTSDDPVLRMRSPAYAVSFGKRLSGQ